MGKQFETLLKTMGKTIGTPCDNNEKLVNHEKPLENHGNKLQNF
jgi:hypothetical protein